MEKIDEVKNRIRNKKNIEQVNNSNKFKIFTLKFLIVLFCFLFGTILVRSNTNIKKIVYENIYNKNISFAYLKNIYNTYIGSILPFSNIFEEKKVFSEKLEYKSLSKYNKGVKLTLKENYAIPAIKGGIVIFIGEKDDMGNTVIVQQSDGIDVWYSNLSNTTVKLYDYIDDNSIIGEAKNNTLYMLFQKSGVEIDYKEILK